MIAKKKRFLEWGIAFWIGVGLMSIINVVKVTRDTNAVTYSWIMFFVSIVLIIIGVVYLISARNN